MYTKGREPAVHINLHCYENVWHFCTKMEKEKETLKLQSSKSFSSPCEHLCKFWMNSLKISQTTHKERECNVDMDYSSVTD